MGIRVLSRRWSLVVACGTFVHVPVVLAAQEVVEVQVSPQVLDLAVGDRERLFFSAFDARGNLADAPIFQLTTSDAGVVRVDSDGTVTGLAPGRATLVVRSGTGSATVSVQVGPSAEGSGPGAGVVQSVDQIVVSPPPSSDPVPLAVGASQRFRVRILGPDSLVPPDVSWSVSDSQVARFDPERGTLLALRPGTTAVTARVPGLAELGWRIRVVAMALSLPDVVTLTPREERPIDRAVSSTVPGVAPPSSTGVVWSTDNPSVVTVDSLGKASAVGLGRAVVTARAGETTATTTVYVAGDLVVTAWGRERPGRGLYHVDLATGTLTPLLVDSASNLYAVRSPSGDAIAFASDREGVFHLYRTRPDGSEMVRLTSMSGHQTQPVWSADGGSLLYTATGSGRPQVFEIAAAGSTPRQLTFGDTVSHSPAVSPDGRTVAFVRGAGADERVFLMDRDGGAVRPAALADTGRFERAPRFFPNGDLAAVIQIGARASAIVRWDRRSNQRIPLVTSDGIIESFAVSRDGRLLVAVVESTPHDPEGKAELLLVDLGSRRARSVAIEAPPGTQLSHPSF